MNIMKFTDIEYLQKYMNIHPPVEGQILMSENVIYTGSDNKWQKIDKITEEPKMTLYDINKSAFAQMPILSTEEEIDEVIDKINNFHNKLNGSNYMLLCKELSYFTVFEKQFLSVNSLGYELINCLQSNDYSILSADLSEQGNLEIWIRTNDNENYCMLLFECSDFIIKFGG